MLPRSTNTRMSRERSGPSGRSQEIQRLVGRSLRVGRRDGQARRAHGVARLRRHPGRRRHAHRGDHRRLRGPGRCHRQPREGGHAGGLADPRLRGRDQRGHGGEPARARPQLRRGLHRRGGHERGDDRRGRLRGGAGHGRADAVLEGAPRRAAGRWPATASRGWSACSAAPSRRVATRPSPSDRRLVLATANRAKGREMAGPPGRPALSRPGPRRIPRRRPAARGRDLLCRERAGQGPRGRPRRPGSWRWPTTRASRWTPSTAARACSPPATAAKGSTDPDRNALDAPGAGGRSRRPGARPATAPSSR